MLAAFVPVISFVTPAMICIVALPKVDTLSQISSAPLRRGLGKQGTALHDWSWLDVNHTLVSRHFINHNSLLYGEPENISGSCYACEERECPWLLTLGGRAPEGDAPSHGTIGDITAIERTSI